MTEADACEVKVGTFLPEAYMHRVSFQSKDHLNKNGAYLSKDPKAR